MILNNQQKKVLNLVVDFVDSDSDCFILRGSAGTGKTTLIGDLVRRLNSQGKICKLIAPTGRAARILHAKTKYRASTIHAEIYSLKDMRVNDQATNPDHPSYADKNDPAHSFYFPLKKDDPENVIFIVDESSMVGNLESKGDLVQFGSGKLLSDLFEYSRIGRYGHPSGQRAKIIFVGDPAQLPPVREKFSPALSLDYLSKHFGLKSEQFELTEVMRQAEGGEILERATQLRDSILEKKFNKFTLSGDGSEIKSIDTETAIYTVVDNIKNKRSIALVTYTNEQALSLNQSVRMQLYGDENLPVQSGDTLLVNKNSSRYGLFNGDLIKVLTAESASEIRTIHMRGADPVKLSFREAEIGYRDLDGEIIKTRCILLENLLTSKERELSAEENRAILVEFRGRHKNLKPNTAKFKEVFREDLYVNALQVKFGYALTCHKAQGGEWDTVVVNFSGSRGTRNEDYFRWSYTAITRASKTLLTISAPDFDQMSEMKWSNRESKIESSLATDISIDECFEDKDWSRFSFVSGQEDLFEYFKGIRTLLAEKEIEIIDLSHLSYCERYTLSCNNQHAVIQYWYKVNGKASKVSVVEAGSSDSEFGDSLLPMFEQVLFSTDDEVSEHKFIMDFRTVIDETIIDSKIRIVATTIMPYRYRIEFDENGKRSKIDFCYDGKEQWTTVEEVGGLDESGGLKERLQKLLG